MNYLRTIRQNLIDLNVGKSDIFSILTLSYLVTMFEGIGFTSIIPLLSTLNSGDLAGNALNAENFGPAEPIRTFFEDLFHIEVSVPLLCLVIVFFLFLREIVIYSKKVQISRVTQSSIKHLQSTSLRKTFSAGYSLFTQNKHGHFANIIISEARNASNASAASMGIAFSGMLCIGYVIVLAYLSFSLTLVCLPLFCVLFYLNRKFGQFSYNAGTMVKQELKSLFTDVSEVFRGIKLIKMRCYDDVVEHEIVGAISRTAKYSQSFIKAKALAESLVSVSFLLGLFLLLYIAVSQFDMTIPEIGIFLLVLTRLQASVSQLTSERMTYQRHLIHLQHVTEFWEEADSTQVKETGTKPFTFGDRILFRDVEFQYSSKSPVLRGISIDLLKNTTTALVGRSGSGKSTIVDLLCGHMHPNQGRITVDDTLYSEIGVQSIREKIGLVSQDTFIFHDTVRFNLTFGLSSPVTDEEIWEILRQVNADDFISEIGGLDAILADDGKNLSGGQRQRIAFARALCQNPQLLILDEPTSALDSETDAFIQKCIADLHGKMTILIIAHKLSSIENADNIYLLNNGMIETCGTHRELMVNSHSYAQLFQLSQQGAQREPSSSH